MSTIAHAGTSRQVESAAAGADLLRVEPLSQCSLHWSSELYGSTGGRLTARAVAGVGSTFTMRVPPVVDKGGEEGAC
jgi:hypothetical protein